MDMPIVPISAISTSMPQLMGLGIGIKARAQLGLTKLGLAYVGCIYLSKVDLIPGIVFFDYF
jgi:hypothetical protein